MTGKRGIDRRYLCMRALCAVCVCVCRCRQLQPSTSPSANGSRPTYAALILARVCCAKNNTNIRTTEFCVHVHAASHPHSYAPIRCRAPLLQMPAGCTMPAYVFLYGFTYITLYPPRRFPQSSSRTTYNEGLVFFKYPRPPLSFQTLCARKRILLTRGRRCVSALSSITLTQLGCTIVSLPQVAHFTSMFQGMPLRVFFF